MPPPSLSRRHEGRLAVRPCERRSPRTLASQCPCASPGCSEGRLNARPPHGAVVCSEKACWARCGAFRQHPRWFGKVSPQKCGPAGTQDGHPEGFMYSKVLADQGPGASLQLGVIMSPGITRLVTLLGQPCVPCWGVCEGRDRVPLVHLRPGTGSNAPAVAQTFRKSPCGD